MAKKHLVAYNSLVWNLENGYLTPERAREINNGEGFTVEWAYDGQEGWYRGKVSLKPETLEKAIRQAVGE